MLSRDNTFYNIMIVTLAAGIIITLLFIFFTWKEPVPFSELFFENSSDLPNKIFLNHDYPFTYTIHSLENSTKTYNYLNYVELYKIYDITEGIYKCIPETRDHVRLSWVEGDLFPNSTLSELGIDNFGVIESFHSESLEGLAKEVISWDEYGFEISFKPNIGLGQFFIIHTDENNVLDYAVGVDFLENSSSIIFKQGEKEIFQKTTIPLSTVSNSLKIVMQNSTLTVLRRDKSDYLTLFSQEIDFKKGKFHLQSLNMLISIHGKTLVYKLEGDFINTRDSTLINEYDISTKDLDMTIKDWQSKRQNYFDMEINETNNTKIIDLALDFIAKIEDTSNNNYPSYLISPINHSSNEAFTLWNNYTIHYEYKTLLGTGNSALILVDENNEIKYSFVIAEDLKKMILIENNEGTLTFSTASFPENFKESFSVDFDVSNDNLVINVNKIPVISKPDIHVSNLSMFFITKNTRPYISQVKIINNDPLCSNRFVFKKCLHQARIKNMWRDTNADKRIPVSTSIISKDMEYEVIEFGEESNAEQSKDPESDNNFELIQDQKIAFNGPNARINNLTNYSYYFQYQILDGAGIISSVFYNLNDEPLYSFILSEQTNETIFNNHKRGILQSQKSNLSNSKRNNILYDYQDDQLRIIMNHQDTIFNISGVNLSEGYFVLETNNTVANFFSARLINNLDKEDIKDYQIELEPCQLRKIGEQFIAKDTIQLKAGEQTSISKALSISTDFDYAKVTVSSDEKEIHFWVIRK